MTPAQTGRARIVVLAGPSGAGKSRLAERLHTTHGWPIVRLDDFYRDEDDPSMPRSDELGIIDWDHPDSWNASEAVAALAELVDTGSAATPVYDISVSRAVSTTTVTAGPDELILAEGIFAAEIVAALRDAGILHSAWCIHHRPFVTFVRRLARDLKERRKPPMVLVRRGLALMRAEPEVVRRQVALGAEAARATDVEARLATSAG
ncbi:putative ATP-binding protein [Janibacter sp. HTCC2649]|uniref:uridine kinase family protein n=1 Tax=Janibacter sp. HTCC2649 TaxID=313589 RepID=UPI0000670EA8|nr:ATP-binding protein [Janibacter sp. HTCC2649]EAP97429.1 putative ATP-binding protein [Janibacter sp. HTCC2649]